MAWNDGAGQYLGPETGGYYNPEDDTIVPLFGSTAYNTSGSNTSTPNSPLLAPTITPDQVNISAPGISVPSSASMVGSDQFGSTADSSMSMGGSTAGALGNAAGAVNTAYNGASTSTTGSVLSGAAAGAQAGAAFGPWGMVIGGVIGGIVGFFGSKSKKAAAKKAFQMQEQASVLPYQQQQANWLQQRGLEQKAIGNYASGYTPGGYNYTNALTGKKGAGFATPGPAGANLPNFNVAPPNVVPGTGDSSLGIAPHSNPSSGINPTAAPGAGYGPTGLSAPAAGGFGYAPPPPATAPAAPAYSNNKSANQQNMNTYQQQYLAYINAQRQQMNGADMSPYAAFNG